MSAIDRRVAQKPCTECGAQISQFHTLDCSEHFAPVRLSLERIADALERLVELADNADAQPEAEPSFGGGGT
jgi:hypothetical protein